MENTNTGDDNSGDWNSGDWNSGDWNSGNGNSGDRNSGDWNSGDRNSGHWNSGDRNSGYFNTDSPFVRMFGKDTGMRFDDFDVSFPDYMTFDLCAWVAEGDMTAEEKEKHTDYKTMGGYLKVYDYKDAWRKAWDEEADDEQKVQTIQLPNFDADIFEEITGIDVRKEDFKGNTFKTEKASPSGEIDVEVITVNGKKYKRID